MLRSDQVLPTRSSSSLFFACLLFGLSFGIVRTHANDFTTDDLEFFEKRVRPLLIEHCYECHSVGADKMQAGLRVDSRAALIEGGDSGEAVVSGDPDNSLLMEAVRWDAYEMPPDEKLPDDKIEMLAEWIRRGAPWPKEAAPQARDNSPEFDLQKRAAEHWAWQPVKRPVLPDVQRTDWPLADLDRFILAKLEQQGLEPAEPADRLAVMRRLHLDLIGLPPTPEEVKAFQADDSPASLERLVDHLLASPHFGERWGRHWLDLVRYAESRGHEFDSDSINAYQYRDYVIRALNADVPYDQLIREHLAGDLLPEPRLHPGHGYNESILGTGFWFLGEWVHSPVDILKDESDRLDNMIDVMSKTFMGVTVSCARCHDHKFDAISTADYYSLTGFLQSSNFRQVRFESMESNRLVAEELTRLDDLYRSKTQELLAKNQLVAPEPRSPPKALLDALVFDYRGIVGDRFLQDGFIFGPGPCHAGDPWLDDAKGTPTIRMASQAHAVNDPIWDGLESINQKGFRNRSLLPKLPRSGRTLRTHTFELASEEITCLVRGEGHVVACVDSHRQIAGPLHTETIQQINAGDEFVRLRLGRYVGHRIHLEFTPALGERLKILAVLSGSDELTKQVIESQSIGNAAVYERFIEEANQACGDQLQRLAIEWGEQRAKLKERIVERSRTAMAMMDGNGEDASIYIRGNSSKPGDIEPRHFLTAIAGKEPMEIESGSGRDELAECLNDPSNPLTSRVIVNRLWHHLMGRGIVPTTDDFGVLGQRPTHPELLDHLATTFDADGKSIKKMIRYLVLSRCYQMTSKADTAAEEADPKNQLWHHRPPKRLEGEAIRDSLLLVAGRLDTKQFGPSVPIHLTPFMTGLGRPKQSGPLDGDGRRAIYIAVRRNFLSPFMQTFDTPSPFSTMGRRNVSNVPAQSLVLMNDPFVVQQARGWAKRVSQYGVGTEEKIRWMYLAAFARQPTGEELDITLEYLGDRPSVDDWSALAHALINTKEFVFLR